MEFVHEIPNSLSPEVCKDLITRFEEDPKKYPGMVAAGVAIPSVKRSVDLRITENKRFDDLDKVLYDKLKIGLRSYNEYLGKTLNNINNLNSLLNEVFHSTNDTGYQMQRIKKGDFYIWHNDYSPRSDRLVAFIWYLNKIEKGKGGTTDFYFNKSIQPEEGKLLIFPATWTYFHTGMKNESDDDKYIVTGFIVNPNKGTVS